MTGPSAPVQACFDGARWHCGRCGQDFPRFGDVLDHISTDHLGHTAPEPEKQ